MLMKVRSIRSSFGGAMTMQTTFVCALGSYNEIYNNNSIRTNHDLI